MFDSCFFIGRPSAALSRAMRAFWRSAAFSRDTARPPRAALTQVLPSNPIPCALSDARTPDKQAIFREKGQIAD